MATSRITRSNVVDHDVPTVFGLDKSNVTDKVRRVRPEYMAPAAHGGHGKQG
ncbi:MULTISPECIES: hypothetical protein [unclassified Mesorhizobium]|uniref:hypothetical protein n=1 Tax=unclassified Mesorhizobium TaxID=325217 RepID=UPI0033388B9C